MHVSEKPKLKKPPSKRPHSQIKTSCEKEHKGQRNNPPVSCQPGPLEQQVVCPQPGPSGLQVAHISDEEDTEDLSEDETCCVYHLFQPVQLQNCVSVVFTKWAQCDITTCKHWTHLKYCCDQSVVRKNTSFYCPCHKTEE